MNDRLINIQKHEDHKTYVASVGTHVVGFAGVRKNYSYEQSGIYVRILALIVKSGLEKMELVVS